MKLLETDLFLYFKGLLAQMLRWILDSWITDIFFSFSIIFIITTSKLIPYKSVTALLNCFLAYFS